MLKVFIGYDPAETIAFHVLAQSILRRASAPVSITPLVLRALPMTRERLPDQTSEFSFTRFLVPWLCRFQGAAAYLDCDMLVRCDIAELFAAADHDATVSVVKHDYTPKGDTKFLGKTQTAYHRKNWSSVMVFNNDRCQVLQPEAVNGHDPAWLRKLKWAKDLGELPRTFNHLVGEYDPCPTAKIVHFTQGTPCFAKYRNCEFAQEWRAELAQVMHYDGFKEYSRPERVEA